MSVDYTKLAAAIAAALAEVMPVAEPVASAGSVAEQAGGGGVVGGEEKGDGDGGVVSLADRGVDDPVAGSLASVGESKQGRGKSEAQDERTWSEVVASSSDDGSYVSAAAGEGGTAVEPTKGFMARYVRIREVDAVIGLLQSKCGHKLPKPARGDVALARYTAATVPSDFVRGRERLRTLASVGDSALDLVVAILGHRRGKTTAEVREKQMACLSDKKLAGLMAASRLGEHLVVAGGVSLSNATTGATAFEAFAGVLVIHSGLDAVERYARSFGLPLWT